MPFSSIATSHHSYEHSHTHRPTEDRGEAGLLPAGWSLKRRIQLLGILVGLTLLSATFLGLQLLHMTESARMIDAVTQVNLALERMTRHYENDERSLPTGSAHTRSLLNHQNRLQAIAHESLADLPGLEGGFYAHSTGQLIGYAYPTYLGSGPKTDIPEAERPAILRLIGQAIVTKDPAHERVERGFDVILFGAAPLLHNGQVLGATWVMHRLPGVRNPQWRDYSLALIAMLTVAGVVAVGAWLIARRLDRAVAHLVEHIGTLHSREPLAVAATGNVELDRVAFAINQLVRTVRHQQTRREQLEHRLHQADRLAILGRLVAGVAHEVRNPLSSIRLKLHLARRGPIELGKLISTFDIVEKEISRLDRLVARLLSIAKPAATETIIMDLPLFIDARLHHWRTRAAEFGVTIDYRPTGVDRTTVWIDQDRLGQILDNLVANAFDAVADTGGTICVAVTMPCDGTLCLAVTDSGPGISQEVRAHLFEPFFTTRPQGTGLGLFLSAEMARASGGTLAYADSPLGGSRFELHLPCHPIAAPHDHRDTHKSMPEEDVYETESRM